MKDLVIIIGTVILGAYIFNMMTGDDPASLKNVSGRIMEHAIEIANRQGDLG